MNIRKAIRHFKIYAKCEEDTAHWNPGYINRSRAPYHFRLAADLGHRKAKKVVGECFVNVSGPQELRFMDDELQVFVRKIKSHFSRRNNEAQYILESPVSLVTETSDFTVRPFRKFSRRTSNSSRRRGQFTL